MKRLGRWTWNLFAIIGITAVLGAALAIAGLVAIFNGQ